MLYVSKIAVNLVAVACVLLCSETVAQPASATGANGLDQQSGQLSIASLMNDSIDPAATALWQAVSYTVTAEGTTETIPTTDTDWQRLREQADTLMQAANTLMLPMIPVGTGVAGGARQDFLYSPEEIANLRTQDFATWRRFAQQMRTTTLQLLVTIERRDVAAYVEAGPPINEACEGCHARFRYRPLNMDRR